MPIRADLSTIQETEERSTEAGSSTGIHRTRSRDEEFPSAISQITEASGGYEIPVSAQLGVGQVASSLLMLGGLPSHLDELDEEEASYFTPDGDLPPPRFPSSQQQLSYVSASGGGGGTIPDAFEPSSWNGGIMSSPSVTQWLAQGGGGTGTGTTPRQIPRETAAPHKRKWLWRGLFVLFLLLVTIAGVIVGMLISGGSDDTTPDSSASAATDRGNGVDGGSSEDIEGTDLTASPIATPSPSSSPTEARFGTVVLPSFPWEDATSRRPTTAPISMAPTTMAPSVATTPGETGLDEGPDNPGNGPDIEEVACPVKPQIQGSSGSDGSYIAKYYIGWNAQTAITSDNKYVGECDENVPVGLTAECLGQGTAVILSHADLCTANGSTITCTDNPQPFEWVEIGCISPTISQMGIDVAVMDGSTICTEKGRNAFINFVTATCGGAAIPLDCHSPIENLENGIKVCANVGACHVDRGVDSCSAHYDGARFIVGSHDECIEDFSTSRKPGEWCELDVECASNVCAAWICREAKGCQGDDCSRDEHCQSNLCLQSSRTCTSP